MGHVGRALRHLAVCLPVCLVAAGCGKKIWITQYPPFYTPELKTIVVLPFRNATGDPTAGRVISEKVAAALAGNGTYEVLARSDLKALADEAELKAAAGDTDAVATLLRKQSRAQGALTGTVTLYNASQQAEWRSKPVYEDEDEDDRDRRGRNRRDKDGRRISHYVSYQYVHNTATVDATARLVRVADGSTIHATAPGKARVTVTDETTNDGAVPPKLGPAGCLAAASDECVLRIVEEFAVVRKEIRVGGDALETATGPGDGEWAEENDFTLSGGRLFVVVKLPAECDRNYFRIVISQKDTGRQAAEQEFIWLRAWSTELGKGFPFDLREIAERGGGPGKYVVRLYSGTEPALDTKFKIEAD